jgi:hypothetical protein
MVDFDPVLKQQPPGRPRLLFPIVRQVDVAPSRVLVEFVPFRFPVPQQDQCVDAVFTEIGQFKGRGSRVQWCPTTDDVADHGILVAIAIVVASAPPPGGHVGSPSSCFLAPGRSPNDHGFLGTVVFVVAAIFVVPVIVVVVITITITIIIIAAIAAAHAST